MEDYKFYYNDSFVLITSEPAQMKEKFAKVLESDIDIQAFIANHDFLFDGSTNDSILILSSEPKKVFDALTEDLDVITAGGGLVFNEHHELLLIHRRGYWDMAKGKIEKNERKIDGAEREVTEETGVGIAKVSVTPIITYHVYFMKGKRCLKDTYWYKMQATPGQSKLVPQTEEDITDVRWVKLSELPEYKAGCYPLIWDLIATHVLHKA